MKHNLSIIAVISMLHPQLHATVLARGNMSGATAQTFGQDVTAKVFDSTNGTLYLGLAAGANTFAITSAVRVNNADIPTFQGIATNNIVTSNGVPYLALSTEPGVATKKLIGATDDDLKTIFALGFGGTTAPAARSATLLDASGAASANGQETSGLVALAANNNFSFVAVAPSTGDFGTPNSGIAVVRVQQTPTGFTLDQTAAVSGDTGIKAQKLDATISQVSITNAATFSNFAAMHWDDSLQRLYIGLELQSGSASGDGARSVVVGQVNTDGTLNFTAIAPNGAITPQASGAQTHIVAGIQNSGAVINLAAIKLRVLHASTGPSYLIVNGGNGDSTNTNNLVFALPLVDNPTSPSTQGTLAKKDSALTNYKFTVPATASGDLAVSTDAAAKVGGGPIPIQASTSVSDMVVVGDTVYVSIYVPQNSSNDTGVLYSQAYFDETGKIVGWTPWTQRAFPIGGIPNDLSPDRIAFFAVDATNGKVWGVGGDTPDTVTLTNWGRGNSAASLTAQLNTYLNLGSYFALDLDQSTTGLGTSRYALFSGTNSVAFARTSIATSATTGSTQTATADYSDTTNFLYTTLPSNAASPTVLEFSRNATASMGYFFAGTQSGLYVFAVNGSGFTTSTMGALNAAPFSTGSWQQAPNIAETVIDVKTSGLALYIMTYTTSASAPLGSKIYRVPFATTIAAMFASPVLIAQSQTATAFSNTLLFNGMQIINTSAGQEQLVIATNTGLFRSSKTGGVQAATSQADAAWALVPAGSSSLYYGIGAMENAAAQKTVWPFSITDQYGLKTFEQGTVNQLSGSTDTGTYSFVPSSFNTTNTITNFWSDGARRFFIINQPQDPASDNRLMAMAYSATNPTQQLIASQVFTHSSAFNWVKQIGNTGILMAGTNDGVVALE